MFLVLTDHPASYARTHKALASPMPADEGQPLCLCVFVSSYILSRLDNVRHNTTPPPSPNAYLLFAMRQSWTTTIRRVVSTPTRSAPFATPVRRLRASSSRRRRISHRRRLGLSFPKRGDNQNIRRMQRGASCRASFATPSAPPPGPSSSSRCLCCLSAHHRHHHPHYHHLLLSRYLWCCLLMFCYRLLSYLGFYFVWIRFA